MKIHVSSQTARLFPRLWFYQSFTEEDNVYFKFLLTDLCWYTSDYCQPCAALPALPTPNTLTTQQGSLPSDKLPRMSSIYVNTDKPIDIPSKIPGKSIYFPLAVIVCTIRVPQFIVRRPHILVVCVLVWAIKIDRLSFYWHFSLISYVMYLHEQAGSVSTKEIA